MLKCIANNFTSSLCHSIVTFHFAIHLQYLGYNLVYITIAYVITKANCCRSSHSHLELISSSLLFTNQLFLRINSISLNAGTRHKYINVKKTSCVEKNVIYGLNITKFFLSVSEYKINTEVQRNIVFKIQMKKNTQQRINTI